MKNMELDMDIALILSVASAVKEINSETSEMFHLQLRIHSQRLI